MVFVFVAMMSAVPSLTAIRRLTIDSRGLHISEGFIGSTGILSGHPSIAAPALSVSDPGARA